VSPDTASRVVVTDANVLINLIHAGRLELLGALTGHRFVVPEQVVAEVTVPAQRSRLADALGRALVRQEPLDVEALALYGELRAVMGRGEAACLATAHVKAWWVASDEKGPFRREALARLGPGQLVTTPGLFVLALRAGLLTVAEADEAKALLERHRFRMKFGSFRELVGPRGP
jgi:predicted nucleic acid-binding protein